MTADKRSLGEDDVEEGVGREQNARLITGAAREATGIFTLEYPVPARPPRRWRKLGRERAELLGLGPVLKLPISGLGAQGQGGLCRQQDTWCRRRSGQS